MNDTEWYLTGGLIAAGVVILILLFLLFKGSSGAGSAAKSDDDQRTVRLFQGHGGREYPGVVASDVNAINPVTGLPFTNAELERELLSYDEVQAQGSDSVSDDDFSSASSFDADYQQLSR